MSEKILQWLLRLYPRRFRSEYGDAMRQLFHDRMGAETGVLGRLRLWMDLLRDLAISVPREHRRRPRVAVVECVGYRMSEQAVAEMVKRSHIRELPSTFLSIALGAMVGWMGHAPLWPLCAVYGLLMFLATASLRGLGRWKDQWRSYELVLDEDRIQQIERGGVTLTLLKTEVTRLLETRDLGMAIQTQDPRRSIWAPSALNGYEELRARLAAWAPVEESPQSDPQSSIHGHRAVQWIFALYPAALLVRSPYFAIPLTALITAPLLNLTRSLCSPRTLPDGALWRIPLAAWLVPLVLIAVLIVKLVLVLR
jgi:hypothetical protein